MEYSSLIHAHKGIIYLFLAFYVFKVVLMFTSPGTFEKVRDKTKIVEMILGPLIVASGVYLLTLYSGYYKTDIPTWLYIKIALVTVGIVLAIIGLKKGKKGLAVLALAIFLYSFMAATMKSLTLSAEMNESSQEILVNKPAVFGTTDCASIHGNLSIAEETKVCPAIFELPKQEVKGL